jgi:predicted aspartyl protease
LKKLGVCPHREVDFSLTDGTTLRRRVGDAYFELQGKGGASPVIFGKEGDKPQLGATTLESIGLVVDPFKRRLIPMRVLLV